MNKAFGMVAIVFVCVMVANANPHMGEYEGVWKPDNQTEMPATAVVVNEGPGYYRLQIESPDSPQSGDGVSIEIFGIEQGNQVSLFGRSAGRHWNGSMFGNRIVANANYYGGIFELKKVTRTSPTLGLKPPAHAVVLLPFEPGPKPDMSAWQNGESWRQDRIFDDGSVQMDGTGGLTTKAHFGDVKAHVEFMCPLEPGDMGQARGNSGVFFNMAYEVQVLDSFGLPSSAGDCGGLYNLRRARVNACLPPGQWQTYDITFRAPRINANGQVVELPRITVVHNGVMIHDNVEITGNTLDPKAGHKATGPFHLQDHTDAVRYRNVWLVEL